MPHNDFRSRIRAKVSTIACNEAQSHYRKDTLETQRSFNSEGEPRAGSIPLTSSSRPSPTKESQNNQTEETGIQLDNLSDSPVTTNSGMTDAADALKNEQNLVQTDSFLFAASLTTQEGRSREHNKLFQSADDFHQSISTGLPRSLSCLSSEEALQSVENILQKKASSTADRDVSRSSLPRTQAYSSLRPPRKIRKKVIDAINHLRSILDHTRHLDITILDVHASQDSLDEASLYVENAFAAVDCIRIIDDEIEALKQDVSRQLNSLNARLSYLYSNIPDTSFDHINSALGMPIEVDAAYVYGSPVDIHDDISQVVCVLAVVCNVIMRLAYKPCQFIIGVAIVLVKLAMSTVSGAQSDEVKSQFLYNPRQEEILRRLPTTLEAALRMFTLDSKFEVYATCPSCNYTNKSTLTKGSTKLTFPPQCQNQIVCDEGRRMCNATLLHPRSNGVLYPIKPYLVGSLADYLARSLADRTFLRQSEKATDHALKRLEEGRSFSQTDSRSVFDSKFMHEFIGPDGKPFLDRGSKIRLAFSLSMDFFNPNGSRKRGNHHSIGIISAANLALDPSIRYLPEYMFLGGIIPGPKEPPLDEVDHFVRPIIEQFSQAWKPGMHVSRTATSARGVTVESAIVLSVNDLPAARKIAGFQGIGSDFICSVCQLHGHHNIFNTSFDEWLRRNLSDLRLNAQAWRNASNAREREYIYQTYGIRWSSFWLLEYWDPTRMLVIDSMHCLMEGLIHYHCRYVLRFDSIGKKVSDEGYRYAFSYPWMEYSEQIAPDNCKVRTKHIGQIRKIQKALCLALEGDKSIDITTLWSRLENVTKSSLRFVAWSLRQGMSGSFVPTVEVLDVWRARDLTYAQKKNKPYVARQGGETVLKNKAHYVALLINWRLRQPKSASYNIPKTATPQTLEHVQFVIKNTITPSWINSVPHNYGEASAGTIKADEWRTLASLYLPIALVTLWGDLQDHERDFADTYLLQVLDHTMALFQATIIACRYSTNVKRASDYRSYLKQWIDNLHIIYPHTEEHRERPNIHAALHIYDFLLEFGPIMSWWCFPFERLIGALQKINTNEHIGGALEQTIMESQGRAANMRRWLRRPDCPQAIKEVKNLFDKSFISTSGPGEIDEPQPAPGQILSHYRIQGTLYSCSNEHTGNATILYRPSLTSAMIAGRIEKIHTTEHSVEFSVRRQEPLPLGRNDPFKRYPHLMFRAYSSHMSETVDIIGPEDIVSHAARFDFSEERSVLCNLSRD